MNSKPNILVVCGRNKRRSRTAEYLFKNDNRFHIRSVGLSPKSERKISEKDLEWSDLIFVMEDDQKSRIQDLYRYMDVPPIETLGIPDEFEYLDEELIELLNNGINTTLNLMYKL